MRSGIVADVASFTPRFASASCTGNPDVDQSATGNEVSATTKSEGVTLTIDQWRNSVRRSRTCLAVASMTAMAYPRGRDPAASRRRTWLSSPRSEFKAGFGGDVGLISVWAEQSGHRFQRFDEPRRMG